ncbi:MAG: hypothetical protein PHP17_04630 [Candidatus Omnitrophica bacterium]|nr:hypothetical protein [Candidatus Omnitrophota bacterium]
MKIEQDNFFIKEEAVIVRWIMALAMVSNDLSFCAKKIVSTQNKYEKVYYFRLALAFLREIAKVIGQAKGNDNINSFVQGLPKEAQNNYSEIMQFLGSYEEDSFVKRTLKNPRDEIFHYPDINGKYCAGLCDEIITLDKISVELGEPGRTIADVHYTFIDKLLWKRAQQGLSHEIVNQLSKLTVNLMSFVDHVFAFLVAKNSKEQ